MLKYQSIFEWSTPCSQAGALPAQGLDGVIAQAKALDMATVHREVAEQQAQQQVQ